MKIPLQFDLKRNNLGIFLQTSFKFQKNFSKLLLNYIIMGIVGYQGFKYTLKVLKFPPFE